MAPETEIRPATRADADALAGCLIGSRLLGEAERAAVDSGKEGLSLIVADANEGARRLYARTGYREIASRPIVREQWQTEARNWILMVKPVG